ncbi:MAG: NTP transferase domain-containing protein [Anaerolineae bacterium]|nr:NTP transferase domain-containing protein [Anaerolineae bacterium]
MIQQAVILAAGHGSRLGVLTKDRPKSMLPILGKPIVARVMDHMREAGIRQFIVVVGENEGAVASYLSGSWHPDTEVRFALQSIPTGTVDALLLAAPYIDGPFLLSSVDNLTSPEHVKALLAQANSNPDQDVVLSLLPATPDVIRKSSDVILNGDHVIAIEEKPAAPRGSWAGIMLYAFSRRFLDYLPQVEVSPRGEREIVSGIQAYLHDGGRVGAVQTDWRLHLTGGSDLLAINRHFLEQGRDTHILSEIPGSVYIIPPVRIDPNVSVGQGAHIGPHVYLESGAAVGQGAVVRNSVVLNRAVIPAGEHCDGQIVSRYAPDSEL